MIIEDIYLYVCKRQFTDKVIVAHACVMEETKATYPVKHSEYNGNKGNIEVTIENPYESKIPTRFILGMVDANSGREIHPILNIVIFPVQCST